MTLDGDLDDLGRMLDAARDLVVRFLDGLEDRPVFPGLTPDEVAARFDEPLPRAGRPLAEVLDRIERDVVTASTLNVHPRFLSNVMSGGSHVGIVAGMLVAALNVNGGKWRVAPAHTDMEQRVVRWLGELVGYPAGGGLLVSGGSSANLHGLAAARAARAGFDVRELGLHAGPQLTVHTSGEAHSALQKAVDLLGLGARHLRLSPPRSDGTADVDAIAAAVAADRAAGLRPIAVVGHAGTVNTGAVDPLDELAALAEAEGLWFHVDGAFGAPAAGTELVGRHFAGIERADSLAVDPHKWLSVPFAAGAVLVRDHADLRAAFSVVPAYLRDGTEDGPGDAMEHGLALSRPFRALKVWMTLLVHGADRLLAEVEDNIRTMRHLADLVDDHPGFERLGEGVLSVVCFRPVLDDGGTRLPDDRHDVVVDALVHELDRDGRTFISATTVDGRRCLRANTVNHRTTRRHVEEALAVVAELVPRAVAATA